MLLRVSKKEEGKQDIDTQAKMMYKKFHLDESNTTILREKGSAYDLDNVKNRDKFLAIIDSIFDADTTTLKDLFLQKTQGKNYEVNLYVWDFQRVMRNTIYGILFCILAHVYEVNIYSYKEGKIEIKKNVPPIDKLLPVIKVLLQSNEAESYSWNISENTKKSVDRSKGVVYSSKGKKWGKPFTDADGTAVKVSPKRELELREYIKSKIKAYESKGYKHYYNLLLDEVRDEFRLVPSKAYLSKIKNGN